VGSAAACTRRATSSGCPFGLPLEPLGLGRGDGEGGGDAIGDVPAGHVRHRPGEERLGTPSDHHDDGAGAQGDDGSHVVRLLVGGAGHDPGQRGGDHVDPGHLQAGLADRGHERLDSVTGGGGEEQTPLLTVLPDLRGQALEVEHGGVGRQRHVVAELEPQRRAGVRLGHLRQVDDAQDHPSGGDADTDRPAAEATFLPQGLHAGRHERRVDDLALVHRAGWQRHLPDEVEARPLAHGQRDGADRVGPDVEPDHLLGHVRTVSFWCSRRRSIWRRSSVSPFGRAEADLTTRAATAGISSPLGSAAT
jgi:hypothetical protein